MATSCFPFPNERLKCAADLHAVPVTVIKSMTTIPGRMKNLRTSGITTIVGARGRGAVVKQKWKTASK